MNYINFYIIFLIMIFTIFAIASILINVDNSKNACVIAGKIVIYDVTNKFKCEQI